MKNNAIIVVKNASNESATKIIFFRSYLSDTTPAIGKNTNVGIKKIKLAIDSIKVLSVSTVIHTNITKKMICEPNNENNCPAKKNI
jgi:hypothetical protein